MISPAPYNFRSFFENAPGLFLVLDPSFTIIAASDAYLEATMRERNAILGRNLFKVFPDHPYNGKPAGLSIMRDSLNQVMLHGQPHEMGVERYDIARPNGEIEERFWNLMNIPVFGDHKELLYIIHKAEDVTHKKRSEVKFNSLLNASPFAEVLVNEKGLIEMINKQAETLLGYNPKEIIGRSIELLVPEEFRNAHLHQREGFMKGDQTRGIGVARRLTAVNKAGTIFPANISLAPVHTEKGVMILATIRDITEENKLNEQVNNLASIVEHSYEAILSAGTDRKIISWNKGAERIFGYTKEETLGKTALELGFLRINTEQKNTFEKTLFQQGFVEEETELYRKDGSVFAAHLNANLIKNTSGQVTAMVFMIRDISARKKAQHQLELLSQQIDQSTDAIFTLDRNNSILSWNKGAEVLYGFTKEEALGQEANLLLQTEATKEDIIAAYKQMEAKDSWAGELKRKTKAGEVVYVYSTKTTVRDDKGAITSYIAVSLNITEQKILRDQVGYMANMLEQSSEAIMSTGLDRRLVSWNKAAENLLGFTREEVIGKTGEELGFLKFNPEYIEAFDRSIIEKGFAESEDAIYHKNGSVVIGHVKASIIKNNDGKPVGMSFVIRDNTYRRKLEDRLKRQNELLEEKVKERTLELTKSEKKFRALIEKGSDIINLLDGSFNVIYRSPSAIRLGGLSDEEVLGKDGRRRIHADDLESVNEGIKLLLSEPGKSVETRFRYQYKEGFYLWLEGIATNLLHDENIKAIVFNYREVSERINAENALKEERDKLARIAATVPGLIYSFRLNTDGSFSFPYASDSFEDIFGYPYDVIKNNLLILFNSPDQEDRELVLTSIAESARNLTPWKLEFKYRHPQKGYTWLEGNAIPATEPGGTIIWHGIIQDITERKTAEDKLNEQRARLKTVTDNLKGITIFQIAADAFENRKFTYISNGVTELTGHTPEEVIKDPSILYSLIVEHDIPRLVAAELESFNKLLPFNEIVCTRNYKGELRWLNIVSAPHKLSNGQYVWDGFNIDITDHVKAEEEVHESEVKYRTLVDQAFDGIIIYTPEGKIIDCNNSACTNLGYTHDELCSMNIINLLSQEGLKKRPMLIEQITTDKPALDYRKVKRKDGSFAEMELVTKRLANGNLLAVGRDITEQQKAREQRALLSSIVSSSDDAIYTEDLEGNITSWNSGAEKIFGYKEAEMLGSNITVIFPKELIDQEKEILAKTKEGEFIYHMETKRIRKDGKPIYISLTTTPIVDNKGKITGVSKISRDITAQKEAEEKLRLDAALLNAVGQAVIAADLNNKVIYWNAAAEKIYGWKYEEAIGKDFTDLIKFEKKEHAFDNIKKVKQGQSWNGEANIIRKDGELIPVLATASPVYDSKGNFAGMLGVSIDISDRKKAEKKIRLMEKKILDNKIQEQKKVARAIIKAQEKERNYLGQELHDNINQILAGTKMHLSLVGKKDEKLKELIQFPLELIDNTIEEIRKLSRGMVTPLTNVNLQTLVNKLVDTLHQKTSLKTVFEYAVNDDRHLPDDLKLNIYRIIQEQVNNILKHAMAKNARISISSKKKEISILIADDGIGFKVSSKRNGIGLSNMANRVKSYNGKINMKSSPGNGSKISISIPY